MKKKRGIQVFIEEVVFAILTIIWIIPIYYFVISSFKRRKDIVKGPLKIVLSKMSFDNFKYVIANTPLIKAMINTGIITIVTLVLVVLAGSMAGFVLGRMHSKFFKGNYKFVVALMVVPFISCLLTIVKLSVSIHTYGTLFGVVLSHTAWNLPFCTFLYTGFMRSIPKELEEAAYVDGCGSFKAYWHVFFPLLKPITATCCIQTGLGTWNDFLVSNSLLNSTKQPTLMVNVNSFFGEYVSEYGYAFASVILAALPIIIAFVFLQKYFIKGLTAGAVKG